MKESPTSLLCSALIKSISVIDKLPPERQERSNRNDMFRLLQALLQNRYQGTVTGRDNYIASQALAYAIAVEHPDKEPMKALLEELTGSFVWYEHLIASADRH